MTKRIVTVVGARPQFIKSFPLSKAFKNSGTIDEILVHTGQHFDPNMTDIFFDELQLSKPNYFLNIHGGSHGQMTGRMLEAMDGVLNKEKPDMVLVYGDTNSTLAGALSAAKLHVPVIHVESGLRSYNKHMPEEINRVLTDHVSSLLFCPTKVAVSNLEKEGIFENVHHVGDVMYDAMLYASEYLKKEQGIFSKKFYFLQESFALMTLHRAESTESKTFFKNLIDFSEDFAKSHALKIVFPVHPRTQVSINQLPEKQRKKIIFIDPLSYLETQFLLSQAQYVLTDSGGLQKEAYFHRVPCITLRTETEWIETIEHGWNRLWNNNQYNKRSDIDDYGTGKSASHIFKIILKYL